jgi:hypothetical protein
LLKLIGNTDREEEKGEENNNNVIKGIMRCGVGIKGIEGTRLPTKVKVVDGAKEAIGLLVASELFLEPIGGLLTLK